jgi:hypothetical protein
MDTLKEKNMLEEMWNSGASPWKIWTSNTEKRSTPRASELLATT